MCRKRWAGPIKLERSSIPMCDLRIPNWDEAPPFGRRETLLRTLRRLHELSPGPSCIVETGTLRDDTPSGRDGDGWSSVAWSWYCSQTGGKLFTVDISESNLDACR